MSALGALGAELRHERRAIAATVLVVTLSLVTLGGLAVGSAYVVGHAVVDGSTPGPAVWLLLGVLVLLRALLTWAEMDLSHALAFRVLARLRTALFDRYAVALPTRRRENTGHAAATALTDTERLEFFYAHTVAQLVAAVVNALLGVTLLALVEPALAGVVLLALAVVAATSRLGRARLRSRGAESTTLAADLSARVVDVLGGLREVLGYGLGGRVRDEVAARGAAAARAAGRVEVLTRLLTGLREAVTVLAAAAVLVVVALGDVPPADAAALVVLALVTLAPAADAAATLAQLQPLVASAERVRAELLRPPVVAPVSAPLVLPEGPLGLAFRATTFRYDARPVLDGFDLVLAPGEHVGLTGPSGAGKSTVVALAGRLWDPGSGVVALTAAGSDVPLDRIADADLRAAVAVVEQDAALFAGTLAEGLLAGTDAAPADLDRLLDAVGLAGVIGPDDTLGESGVRLSGGQRARLRLVRALLRRPRVLVVDEPTADLDAEAAARVEALLRSYEGTVLVVSHRPSTLAATDRVARL
ncbi:ABC transporter ATP-binding protein [Nocardioides sp. LML1-1-1.1]|uniref:ABC transporter ATP-binding protein n=1 Tax=Nocardioides sp. LML1-1-1.1 TaxID=3135248 RepID=UPI00343B85EA